MTNYEWLLNMSGEERQAWFDAPRADWGQVDGSDVDSGADSREQLERDIDIWLDRWIAWSIPKDKLWLEIIGWLDRQAEITERECMERHVAAQIGQMYTRHDVKELRAQVAELRAENDALMAAHADDVERLDAMGEGELQAQVDELTAERDKAARESELYRARVSDLLDAIQEAWRVGNLDYSVVDMEGEVVS